MEGETQVEMESHAKSYSLFAAMMKWGAIASFVAAMLVIFLIAE
ncbi:MAG TPA: aa3-type cytochrome c oxidase subunit IV [Allosphingosinicella sp.]|nr:aa3-type cytochrome c oxidase subunit IV [Allosphingosinicella sp.]